MYLPMYVDPSTDVNSGTTVKDLLDSYLAREKNSGYRSLANLPVLHTRIQRYPPTLADPKTGDLQELGQVLTLCAEKRLDELLKHMTKVGQKYLLMVLGAFVDLVQVVNVGLQIPRIFGKQNTPAEVADAEKKVEELETLIASMTATLAGGATATPTITTENADKLKRIIRSFRKYPWITQKPDASITDELAILRKRFGPKGKARQKLITELGKFTDKVDRLGDAKGVVNLIMEDLNVPVTP